MSARERFPRSYKECFVPLSNPCGILQSTSFGAQCPRWHSYLSLVDVGFHNPSSLRGPTSLLAHCLMSTPLQGSTSSLVHCPVSGSDTICNGPSPPVADIILFGLSLKVFKMRILGSGFHTLIKNVSFHSPTHVGSQNNVRDES